MQGLPGAAPEIEDFAAAWCDWRGDDVLPGRGEVDLNDIRVSLPRAMVIEVRTPSEAVFRLVGTIYQDLFGVELTGLNYVDLAPADMRELRGKRFWAMASLPGGGYVPPPHGRPTDEGDAIQTLCLRVRPEAADAPMQLFCVSVATTRLDRGQIQDVDLVINIRGQVSFVDIGAGLPRGL